MIGRSQVHYLISDREQCNKAAWQSLVFTKSDDKLSEKYVKAANLTRSMSESSSELVATSLLDRERESYKALCMVRKLFPSHSDLRSLVFEETQLIASLQKLVEDSTLLNSPKQNKFLSILFVHRLCHSFMHRTVSSAVCFKR